MSRPKQIHLCARYYAKPRDPSQTHVKGYMTDPSNIAWDEKVDITLGLKDKDLLESRLVLNINTQTVVKDGFKSDRDFMELFSYFYNANPKQIAHALQRFGISVGTRNDTAIQENVQNQEEASGGSVGAAETESSIS